MPHHQLLDRQRVLWAGTVGFDRGVDICIEAASATGYRNVSVVTQQLRTLSDDDLGGLAAHARRRGVVLSVLDAFYSWLPLEGSKVEATASSVDDVLRQARALGSVMINALALPSAADLELDDKVERFAGLCDTVADDGCTVILEFSPLGGVQDLAGVLEIVDGADRTNGGILFDTWHFFRGNPDFDLLASCRAEWIKAVQISDAAEEVRDSLWKDTIHHRRVPGEGSFDLVRVLQVLEQRGALDWYGPEVISDELHALEPAEAVRTATRAMDDVLLSAIGP